MKIDDELRRNIMAANLAEETGQHALAEKLYREALRRVAKRDRTAAGSLYINLGSNAQRAGDLRAAAASFAKAAEMLEGARGEAVLQRAHALFNLARIQLDNEPRKAAKAAAEAVATYSRYPLTSTDDLADARVLEVLALIRGHRQVSEERLRSAWETIREARFDALNTQLAAEFLSVLVQVLRARDPEASAELVRDLDGWADPALVQELQAVSAYGAEGAALHRRLQRALLGSP